MPKQHPMFRRGRVAGHQSPSAALGHGEPAAGADGGPGDQAEPGEAREEQQENSRGGPLADGFESGGTGQWSSTVG